MLLTVNLWKERAHYGKHAPRHSPGRIPPPAHFEYFAAMANPYVGVTVKVDAGALLHACRAAGTPFSLSVIYCMGRRPTPSQLRQRISGAKF